MKLLVRGKRIRGNVTPRVVRERRTTQALWMMTQGLTQTEIAKQLSISRSTLWRNLRPLRQECAEANSKAIVALIKPLIERAKDGDMDAALTLMKFLEGC